MVSETEFQSQVIDLAEWCGWLVQHTHDSRRGPTSGSGFPDLVMVKEGVILWRELKVGKNQPTAKQSEWGDRIRRAGGDWGVWWPRDWDEIERMLKQWNTKARTLSLDTMRHWK